MSPTAPPTVTPDPLRRPLSSTSSAAPAGSAARAGRSRSPTCAWSPCGPASPGEHRPGHAVLRRRRHRRLPGPHGVVRRAAGPPRARALRGRRGPPRLRRPARPGRDARLARGVPGRRATGPPGRRPASPSTGAAGTTSTSTRSRAVQRRAEQLLGRLRRRRADEGLPPGHARREPRHRDPRRADAGRGRTASPRSTAGSSWRPTARDEHPIAAGDAPAVPRRRHATAGTSRSPAPPPLSTRHRGRTSPRTPGGSASPSARCTRCCARQFGTASPDGAATRRRDGPAAGEAATRSSPTLAATRGALEARLRPARRRHRRRAAHPRRPAPRPDPAHPPRAGSSSTSRASPPSPSPSAGCPTPPGATSPACCAPSTTPPSR